MEPRASFRLLAGEPAPRQQSPVTCGSACLVVARLLIDPGLARWVALGVPDFERSAALDRLDHPTATPADRFASLERLTMARTNAMRPAAQTFQLPWPRALGTPPWGAKAELEQTGSLPGTIYRTVVVRSRSPQGRQAAQRQLAGRVRPGRPALLYLGSDTLPRHASLVFVNQGEGDPLLYEPARGEVFRLDEIDLGAASFRLAGWPRLWVVVMPTRQVVVDAPAGLRRARAIPAVPGGAYARSARVSSRARSLAADRHLLGELFGDRDPHLEHSVDVGRLHVVG